MLTQFRSRVVDVAPGAAFIAALLLCLEVAANCGWVNRALLPAPSSWALVLWDLITTGQFIAPLTETLLRLAGGFAIGVAAGIGLGLLMGYWRPFYDFMEPLVELMRPIPKAALVPAMVLFLGIGDSMKITSIALVIFFPVLINTVQGVRGTDPVMIDTARTFGYGSAAILWKIVFPAALPFIFAAMRVALGLGMVLAVLSEMVAGSGGMGFLILDMQRSFRVRQMYAARSPFPPSFPPLVLLLGVQDAMKVTVVALTVVFPVLTNMVQGVLAVDATVLAVARTFHVGKLATIWKIILPATLPYLLAGMRVSLSLALIVTVVAEMIAGNQGIGHYLVLMQYAVRPQEMYASILLLALSGYLLNRIFVKIEKRLIHWYLLTDTRQVIT